MSPRGPHRGRIYQSRSYDYMRSGRDHSHASRFGRNQCNDRNKLWNATSSPNLRMRCKRGTPYNDQDKFKWTKCSPYKVAWSPVTKNKVAWSPATKNKIAWSPATKKKVAWSPVTKKKVAWSPVTKNKVAWSPATKNKVTWSPATKKRVAWSPVTKKKVAWSPATKNRVAWSPVSKNKVAWSPATKNKVAWSPVTKNKVAWSPKRRGQSISVKNSSIAAQESSRGTLASTETSKTQIKRLYGMKRSVQVDSEEVNRKQNEKLLSLQKWRPNLCNRNKSKSNIDAGRKRIDQVYDSIKDIMNARGYLNFPLKSVHNNNNESLSPARITTISDRDYNKSLIPAFTSVQEDKHSDKNIFKGVLLLDNSSNGSTSVISMPITFAVDGKKKHVQFDESLNQVITYSVSPSSENQTSDHSKSSNQCHVVLNNRLNSLLFSPKRLSGESSYSWNAPWLDDSSNIPSCSYGNRTEKNEKDFPKTRIDTMDCIDIPDKFRKTREKHSNIIEELRKMRQKMWRSCKGYAQKRVVDFKSSNNVEAARGGEGSAAHTVELITQTGQIQIPSNVIKEKCNLPHYCKRDQKEKPNDKDNEKAHISSQITQDNQKKGSVLDKIETILMRSRSRNAEEPQTRVKLTITNKKMKEKYLQRQDNIFLTYPIHKSPCRHNHEQCRALGQGLLSLARSDRLERVSPEFLPQAPKKSTQATQTSLVLRKSNHFIIANDLNERESTFQLTRRHRGIATPRKEPVSIFNRFSSRVNFSSSRIDFFSSRSESMRIGLTKSFYLKNKRGTSHERNAKRQIHFSRKPKRERDLQCNVNRKKAGRNVQHGERRVHHRQPASVESATTMVTSNVSYWNFARPDERSLMETPRKERKVPAQSPSFSFKSNKSGFTNQAVGANMRQKIEPRQKCSHAQAPTMLHPPCLRPYKCTHPHHQAAHNAHHLQAFPRTRRPIVHRRMDLSALYAVGDVLYKTAVNAGTLTYGIGVQTMSYLSSWNTANNATETPVPRPEKEGNEETAKGENQTAKNENKVPKAKKRLNGVNSQQRKGKAKEDSAKKTRSNLASEEMAKEENQPSKSEKSDQKRSGQGGC